MPSPLSQLQVLPLDEAWALMNAFDKDTCPNKVSLGVGVYRDDNGMPWILPSVKMAKERLHEANITHEYLPIRGSPKFLELAKELVLGSYGTASNINVSSIQTISGTGALHLGALFCAVHVKPRNVFISDPTWKNHHSIWSTAAPFVTQKTYSYFNSSTNSLDFDSIFSTLEREAVENDVVLLHACAHNPTGRDPTRKQWMQLAQLCKQKKLFVFFDSAYQGFASGNLDDDAWAIRYFCETLFAAGYSSEESKSETSPGLFIAQSFSKNFGIYGERAGAMHLVTNISTPTEGPTSQLVQLQRSDIGNPPSFGARIVEQVLSDPQLRSMWIEDLTQMATRIKTMRQMLRSELEQHNTKGDWSHIDDQIGMFSYTGLTRDQVLLLRDKYHVYLMETGRISLSGLNSRNVAYVANAISEVVGQNSI